MIFIHLIKYSLHYYNKKNERDFVLDHIYVSIKNKINFIKQFFVKM